MANLKISDDIRSPKSKSYLIYIHSSGRASEREITSQINNIDIPLCGISPFLTKCPSYTSRFGFLALSDVCRSVCRECHVFPILRSATSQRRKDRYHPYLLTLQSLRDAYQERDRNKCLLSSNGLSFRQSDASGAV